jgi:hypothetical protein
MAAAPMANGPRVALVMARLAAIQQGLRLQGACFHSPSVFHGHAHTPAASSTNTRAARSALNPLVNTERAQPAGSTPSTGITKTNTGAHTQKRNITQIKFTRAIYSRRRVFFFLLPGCRALQISLLNFACKPPAGIVFWIAPVLFIFVFCAPGVDAALSLSPCAAPGCSRRVYVCVCICQTTQWILMTKCAVAGTSD